MIDRDRDTDFLPDRFDSLTVEILFVIMILDIIKCKSSSNYR